MKNIKFYILLMTFLLLTCSFFAYASESKLAKIYGGQDVLLRPNGTWEYQDIVVQYSDEYFEMGKTVKVNNVSLSVNSAHYKKDNNQIWLVINCSIRNLNSIPVIISSLTTFTLTDVKGNYQDLSLLANIDNPLDGRLMPNQTVNGEIAFEVDLSNEYYWELVFRPDLVNPGQAIYLIMKEQIK
ncbi:DUF4352 domain-containing protein [candidate division WOR-3 bacterium]|nr:DUF4352 domain-containing protein [candidate division WOR-3 bacterium]